MIGLERLRSEGRDTLRAHQVDAESLRIDPERLENHMLAEFAFIERHSEGEDARVGRGEARLKKNLVRVRLETKPRPEHRAPGRRERERAAEGDDENGLRPQV